MIDAALPAFITIRWLDIVDIILVAFLIYQLYKIVKGTVAIKIFAGILAIYLFWKLVEALKMELLSEILGQFIGVGVIALIIVFQQELRRFLILIGTTGFRSDLAKRLFNWKTVKTELNISAIVNACSSMSKSKTGALIALSRTSDLYQLFSTGGEEADSKLSSAMIESIFFKNSPLHDGAVIISGNRIRAARCVLPVSEKKDFPSHLGMRHRAAVGITENSDGLAIVVSEQNGNISFCKEGIMQAKISPEELATLLQGEFH